MLPLEIEKLINKYAQDMSYCEQHQHLQRIMKDRSVGSFYSRLLRMGTSTMYAKIVHWVARYGGLSNSMLRSIYYNAVRERTYSSAWLNCSVWLFHKMIELEMERLMLWGMPQDFTKLADTLPQDSLPLYLMLAYGLDKRVFGSLQIRWMLRDVLPASLQRHWVCYEHDFEPDDIDWPHVTINIMG